ncbi:MAG TPA: GGDEF and EAL domain-containing protein [Candidatus Limnocylindrales bacterium]
MDDESAAAGDARVHAADDARLGALVARLPVALFAFHRDAHDHRRTWDFFTSPQVEALTGYPPGSFGHPRDWRTVVHPEDAPTVFDPGRLLFPGATSRLAYRIRHRDGRVLWLREESTVTPDGDAFLVQGLLSDITDQVAAEVALEHLARHDPLTDLADRTYLRERLDASLTAARHGGWRVGLLFLDLDLFKDVNDTLGHRVGDGLLVQVARRLAEAVRTSDTVARLGGDEFGVLLPKSDEEGATRVARALVRALDGAFTVEGHRITIAASIGIAVGTGDADALMRQADRAMYQAKRERAAIAVFDPSVEDPSLDSGFARLGELRTAIETGQLVLHYQPWLDLRTRAPRAVEALVRWRQPGGRLLLPGDFLPLAERHGLMRDLDAAVLEAACAQAARWRDEGRRLRTAVNISRPTLLSEEFPAILAAALIRHRLQGPELELEITENGVLGDPEQAAWLAERLTALGVRLAIDDFGTGYSSLGQLRRMRVSTLKVDRSFVSGVLTSPDDQAIVETIVELGHRLGLTVVAEGVEDTETLAYLAALGCDQAQGFLISRPIPPVELERWLGHGPAEDGRVTAPTKAGKRPGLATA